MFHQGIRFEFDERKATAAAAVLLKKARGRMSYLRLLKLLYIAERESLRRRNRPIVGDRYLSMKHGPVMEGIYTLIKADERDLGENDLWLKHIKKAHYDLELTADPGVDPLSESEIEILEEVFDRYRDRDQWELRDLTHAFPEWRNPGESCSEIPAERILQMLQKTDEEIEDIAREVGENSRIDALLRGEATP